MNCKNKVSKSETILSSISGAGPLVNFAILISYSYYYASDLIFISFILAFILFITFFNAVYEMSRTKVGKGGYYLFVQDYYKNDSIFIYIYFIYSFSSIISLLTFISFILFPDVIKIQSIYYYIIFILILLFIYFIIKYSIRGSIRYASVGALLEISFILIISIVLLLSSHFAIPSLKISSISNIFIGGIFSVLIFAGLGSPISFGDMLENPYKNLKNSILISAIIEGSVFIFSSFVLGIFLYDSGMIMNLNAVIPILQIIKNSGFLIYLIFMVLLINSFLSILLLYSISFTRTYHTYLKEKMNFSDLLNYFILFIMIISILSIIYFGIFDTFLLATSIASINWLLFHDVLNLSLIKNYFNEKKYVIKRMLIPSISIIISFFIIFFILYSETFPFYLSPIFTLIIILMIQIKYKFRKIKNDI